MKRIEETPEIMMGKPVIKGIRITLEMILKRLSEGKSHEELLQNYPQLEKDDIYATLAYVSNLIANE